MCVHPYIKEISGNLVPLPCGKCIECRSRTTFDYQFRLEQELKNWSCCWFITLTYNDAYLPEINGLSCVIPSEVQNFLKRFRQNCGYPPLKYFAIGEYGGKYNRAHYHLLLYTDAFQTTTQAYIQVLRAWSPRGYVYCKPADPSVHFKYLTKYVNKLDMRYHHAKPFRLMSKGLGLSFLSDSMCQHLNDTLTRKVWFNGELVALPRYYVKKLDNDQRFDYNGLKWSERCLIHRGLPNFAPCTYQWYHEYFCRNYKEIREVFIERELESPYITKFLDPPVNMVFGWFLVSNNVTADADFQSREKLYQVSIKNHLYVTTLGSNYVLLEQSNDFP